MSLIRKTLSVTTLGTVGWNGQRATRAKNDKAQAHLAKAEAEALAKRTDAELAIQAKLAKAQVKALRSQPAVAPLPAAISIAAGWHRDPHGIHELRYWDGSQWTQHVSDSGNVAIG